MQEHNWITDVSEGRSIPCPIVLGKDPVEKNIGFEAICFEQPNTEEKTMSMGRHIQIHPS
jgi:hypothetical protein